MLLTSDRGFAGGFNANVLREGEALNALLRDEGSEVVPYVAGRKGTTWYKFRGRTMAGEWTGFSDRPDLRGREGDRRRRHRGLQDPDR